MKISEAFAEIVALAQRKGVSRINELPGCWECQVDDQWRIALNGHQEPAKCDHAEVPPFSAYVTFNGWPAGIIDPAGGLLFAGTEGAFIEALRRSGQ